MPSKEHKHPSIKPQTTKMLLVSGFASVISILLIISSIGLGSMSILSGKLSQTVNDNNIRSQHGYEMRNSSRERIVILHQMARTDDPFERDELFIKFRHHGGNFLKAREKITSLALDEESQKLLNLQREFSTVAGSLQYQVIDLLNLDQIEKASHILIDKVIPAQDRVIEVVDTFIRLQQKHNNHSLLLTNEDFDQSFQLIILLTATGILISILLSLLILRRTNFIFNALYNSELREKVIRENIVDAVVTYNVQGVLESCNKAIKDIFGYEPSDMIGKKVDQLISVDDVIYNDNKLGVSQLANVANSSRQITSHHKDGTEISLHVGISKVIINKQPLYIAVLSDITDQIKAEESLRELNEKLEIRVVDRTQELQQANEKLKYLANHDTVTNLPNRALLHEHLDHILASANRLNHKVGFFFLDIDGFKQINDTYGHAVGDLLLKEIGNKLIASLRKSDLLARVGGDEFIAILDDVRDNKSLETIGHKLISTIGESFNIKNHICHIGVSIGISVYPQDGKDIETLIGCADQAMYKIKSSGKNNLYFYKDISSN